METVKEHLLTSDETHWQPVTYPSRWWIALTYGLLAMVQGAQWTIPGSIQPTMEAVYGLDGNTIQLLLNYGPIAWFAVCIPVSWHMDRHGARVSVLAGLWLIFISALLRVFANDSSTLSVALVHVSFMLNGFAGPVAMAACSKLSEDWFAPAERTFATSVMAEANNCAGVLMWLLLPTIMTSNDGSHMLSLNYCFLGLAGVSLGMGLVYFPSRPPTPPSASAQGHAQSQHAFTMTALWGSLVSLSSHRGYMVLMTTYAFIAGLANSLSSLLVVILANIGYSTVQAGWVGFVASVVGMGMGIILARHSDKRRNARHLLLVLLVSSGLAWLVFAVVAHGWLPGSFTYGTGGFILTGIVYTLCNCLFDAAIPLIFELAVEATYPLPEGTTLMYMTTSMNLATALALLVPQDSAGVTWMPWGMAGLTLLFAALVGLLYDESSPRYDFDTAHSAARKSITEAVTSAALYKSPETLAK